MSQKTFTGDMTVGDVLELHPGFVTWVAKILQDPRYHGFIQAQQSLREVAGRMEIGTSEFTRMLDERFGREVSAGGDHQYDL